MWVVFSPSCNFSLPVLATNAGKYLPPPFEEHSEILDHIYELLPSCLHSLLRLLKVPTNFRRLCCGLWVKGKWNWLSSGQMNPWIPIIQVLIFLSNREIAVSFSWNCLLLQLPSCWHDRSEVSVSLAKQMQHGSNCRISPKQRKSKETCSAFSTTRKEILFPCLSLSCSSSLLFHHSSVPQTKLGNMLQQLWSQCARKTFCPGQWN